LLALAKGEERLFMEDGSSLVLEPGTLPGTCCRISATRCTAGPLPITAAAAKNYLADREQHFIRFLLSEYPSLAGAGLNCLCYYVIGIDRSKTR